VSVEQLQALAARARALGRPPAPPAPAPRLSIANAAGDRAEVYIYGVIGSDWFDEDVTAASFVAELREITAPAIDLHINSPGGLVFDGIAIYSALVNHDATVHVHVDGLAASAASFVAMAGDSVSIEKPAKMFIHDAQGVAWGGPDVMRQMAELLDELSDTVAAIYADRAGGTVDSWRDAMRDETWYSAAQAVEAGLADHVANDSTAAPDNRRGQTIRARHRARGPRRAA
jgi:ATP-dependent protease ClpP protease subunit